jgi:hypothetical protein
MKKGVKILIAIIAVVVVLGGVAAGLFFTGVFDYLKPARKTWSKQVQKALDLDGVKVTDYAEVMDEYKDMYEKPSKSSFEISANLSISQLDEDIQKTINNSKIKVESSQNIKEKASEAKITLESDNSKVIDFEVVTNKDKFGVASKDLYDKYLTVSLEDLEEYVKNNNDLDAVELPSNVDSISELYGKMGDLNPYDLLYVSKDDLKSIEKTYKKVIENSIDKKAYTKKANVKVKVDGDEVSTTGYYLTLSGEDAKKLVDDLAEAVADDDTLNKLVVEKANMIMEAMGEDKISSDDVKELLNNLTAELKESAQSLKDFDNKGIQIAVYSKLSKPVRLEVNYIDDMDDIYDTKTLLSIEYAKKKDIYRIMPDEAAQSITIVDSYTKKTDKERIGSLSIKISGIEIGSIDYEIINKDNEKKIALEGSISELIAKQAGLEGGISVKIEVSAKGNYKKEPVEVYFNLEGKYGKESAKITVNGTVEYDDNVSITELNSSNSTSVLKLNETEQAKLYDEILKKASEVLPARLKLLGVNVKAEDIYNPTITNLPVKRDEETETSDNALTGASEVITAEKENGEGTGKYTETLKISFKDGKIVAATGTVIFDDKNTADMFEEYLQEENVTRTDNKFVIVPKADAFAESLKLENTDLTKEDIVKALKDAGYTVK